MPANPWNWHKSGSSDRDFSNFRVPIFAQCALAIFVTVLWILLQFFCKWIFDEVWKGDRSTQFFLFGGDGWGRDGEGGRWRHDSFWSVGLSLSLSLFLSLSLQFKSLSFSFSVISQFFFLSGLSFSLSQSVFLSLSLSVLSLTTVCTQIRAHVAVCCRPRGHKFQLHLCVSVCVYVRVYVCAYMLACVRVS